MSDLISAQEEARLSLARIHGFDAESLVQSEKLGEANFRKAVEPARRLISLFKQIPESIIEYLPESEANEVKNRANSAYQLFEEIMNFTLNEGDVSNRQNQIVERIRESYQGHFTKLHPIISYSVAKTANLSELEQQGRASIQAIRDSTNQLISDVENQKEEASKMLEEIRAVAAEQGVAQMSIYFKNEADSHANSAF